MMDGTTQKPKILLVDDDTKLLKSAALLLKSTYEIHTAETVPIAKAVLNNQSIDVAVVDLNFEGHEQDGLSLIDWISENQPQIPVVVLSGDTNTARVVSAMRRMLVDFVPKGDGIEYDYEKDLRCAINRGLDIKRRQSPATDQEPVFKTRSPQTRPLLDRVEKIVRNSTERCTLLITGENGTGKEVLAKHIAARFGKPLVAANMAAIPTEMAESQLFGHLKGAFTGATENHIGLIEQAHNGIFFLDEIGDCSLAVQAKLLRAIQEREITPMGGTKPRRINVRFMAATNRNLGAMIQEGLFREDLFHRLSAITLHIPPLQERPEDIEYLARMFLDRAANGRPFSIRASGMERLLSHPWPGNVRELEQLIERIAILADRLELDADLVSKFIQHPGGAVPGLRYGQSLGDISTRSRVLEALENSGGNRTVAARELNVDISTLYRWLKKFGIGDVVKGKPGRPTANSGPGEFRFTEEVSR